uniref:Mechanosensitive ion channel MscS domain-containing protein n=1 Tax=Pseudo-nitzschia delicatissima TaxID=44447 RepID=A0A7S0TAV2_9STRA|mmetsp:Transcript_1719/g.3999  ORF Transcript_1719/g.3999 Transcript_1719/m.3999 type:complete len:419 (+) Transcript_1719:199-1455(+)
MLKPSAALASPNGIRSIDALLALRGGDVLGETLGDAVVSTVPTRFDPLIQKFLPGHEQHPNFILALILAFALQPVAPTAKVHYHKLSFLLKSQIAKLTKRESPTEPNKKPYKGSRASKVIETIVEAARLLLLVGAFDIGKTTVECLGLRFPKSETLTQVFGWGIFLFWGFRRVGRFKLFVLKKTMAHTDLIKDPRRLYFIDRLMDYALVFFGIFAFYEVLEIEMGYSGQSLLAAFSFGTAAIALATKEIITNFLNGVILSASDRIFVGDYISMQGDIKRVSKLGWLETKLQGSDDILYTVPNTELVNTKLSNLSRVKSCQVSQTLRFPYSAMEKLTKLSHDIKAEIRTACPAVITDGSRPFRCYWTNFQKDYLEVMVNAHFRIPPVGDAYYENRQRCLLAIDRAIRRNEIESYSGAGQ